MIFALACRHETGEQDGGVDLYDKDDYRIILGSDELLRVEDLSTGTVRCGECGTKERIVAVR